MKVNKLIGALLDYWVAKAQGDTVIMHEGFAKVPIEGKDHHKQFRPSASWRYGGPIIEKNSISVLRTYRDTRPIGWVAEIGYGASFIQYDSEYPLVAAMRCYVASKFGDEVPDEPK